MTTDETSKEHSSGAERMRRHRQRRRKGLRHFGIDLREAEIDALIRRGLLPPESRTDRTAVVEALYTFLDSTLRGPK
jgi:hypothetical protein